MFRSLERNEQWLYLMEGELAFILFPLILLIQCTRTCVLHEAFIIVKTNCGFVLVKHLLQVRLG